MGKRWGEAKEESEDQTSYEEALASFSNLPSSLTSLNVTHCHLPSFPSPLLSLSSSLAALCLFRNNLTSVPPEIAVFTCLKDLDLDENNISILPPEMGQLSCLEMLLVRGNGIKEIDEAVFEGMTNLKVL